MTASDIGTVAPRTAPTERSAHGPSDPVKLTAVVLGLTAVIALMLLAFALPAVNSGPHDLRLGVAGPDAAVTGSTTRSPRDTRARSSPSAFPTPTRSGRRSNTGRWSAASSRHRTA